MRRVKWTRARDSPFRYSGTPRGSHQARVPATVARGTAPRPRTVHAWASRLSFRCSVATSCRAWTRCAGTRENTNVSSRAKVKSCWCGVSDTRDDVPVRRIIIIIASDASDAAEAAETPQLRLPRRSGRRRRVTNICWVGAGGRPPRALLLSPRRCIGAFEDDVDREEACFFDGLTIDRSAWLSSESVGIATSLVSAVQWCSCTTTSWSSGAIMPRGYSSLGHLEARYLAKRICS